MPLYRKALNFNAQDLDTMTYDECYELLLCFRYLHLRDDHRISKTTIVENMEKIQNRMELLKNPETNAPEYN